MPEFSHAQILRDAITDLTARFAHSTDIETTLAAITSAAVQLIPGVDSADVLVITNTDEYRSLAATSQLVIDSDQLQQRHSQGPCLDATVGETMVRPTTCVKIPAGPGMQPWHQRRGWPPRCPSSSTPTSGT